MKTNVTKVMVEEHKLILRMISLVEKNTALLEQGKYRNWQFYLDAVDFIRNFADRFHHADGIKSKNSPFIAFGRNFAAHFSIHWVDRHGGDLRALKSLLGNSEIESKIRCLGKNIDGAIELAEGSRPDVGATTDDVDLIGDRTGQCRG